MASFFAEGGTWRRIAEEGRLMVFERADGKAEEEREIRLCGVFDDEGQLAMILNVIHMSKLDGALHVSTTDKRAVLYFRQGNYLSARSNQKSDRLGEILVKEGRLSDEEVSLAMLNSEDQDTLGQALVKQGLITTQEVYSTLQKQAQQILVSAMRFGRGTFCLVAPLDMTEVPAMLHMDTQSVLLDALRTIDEIRAAGGDKEEEGEELVPNTGESKISDEGAKELISTYNKALAKLFLAVDPKQQGVLIAEAQAVLDDNAVPYHSIFKGVTLDWDGTLDRIQLEANLRSDPEHGTTHLQVGLSEFLFYLLFAAGDSVDAEAKRKLHRDVADAMRGMHKKGGK